MNIDNNIDHADWSLIESHKRELHEEYMHGFVFGFVIACLLILAFGL